MTGTPQQNNPQQPYETHGQLAQQTWSPPVKNRKGGMGAKAWGIILLILGVLGVLMLVLSVASVLGGGVSASTFSFGVSEEAKAEIDRIGRAMIESALGRWSFWLNIAFELIIAVVSLVAGYLLVIRPSPKGRKLAIARALIVMLALPVYGYENISATEQSMGMMSRIQQIQINDVEEQMERDSPSDTPEEREARKRRIEEQLEGMQTYTKGAAYGMVVATVVFILVLNSVLLFSMTRPSVKEYLEAAADEGVDEIPGYDPSMGMMGPPPQAQHPGAVPSPGPQPPESELPPPTTDDRPKPD